jgi:hypothetical protein
MLQVWFLSWQTRVYARKPMPATPPGFFPQFIPDSNARRREPMLSMKESWHCYARSAWVPACAGTTHWWRIDPRRNH